MLAFTLDQLLVFDAIAREGSFAAAAKATHRSTPAVSYAIKALEEALELPLFDRTGHRARLTAGGRLVLTEARSVIEKSRDLDQVARLLRQDWEPQLTVVVDGLLPMHPCMRAVQRLTELGAPTQIRVLVEYLSGVHGRFERDHADLMITLEAPVSPAWVRTPLPPVGVQLCAHKDHPLAGKETVHREDLIDHVELVVADSGGANEEQTHRLWLGSPHIFQVSDFHTKAQAVREGVGYGWLPSHLIQADLERGDLVRLPFTEGAIHTFVPQLIRHAGRPRGRAERFFARCILEGLGVSAS